MFTWQCILMWISAVAASVLSVVGLGILCEQHQVFPGRRLLGAFRRLPWPVQFFLLAFSLHMIVHGSMKTNAVGGVEGDVKQRGRDRNVASPLYEIPQPEAGRVSANAELAQNWWRRGCWDDWRTVAFEDGWVFPHGSNHLSQVVVMSQGEILLSLCDEAIVSLGANVAHIPFDTCFYHEHTPSNSYRFVWDRAYIERSTNMPMCATIELFRNGNYTVSTNGCVTDQFVREPPFPHDGIGQDDDWVRANFTNATDILAVGYANWVDAQVGVDLTNGLYKFTATFPDDPPEATELIVGDLSVCVTNAGEYVFVLEKGVEYDFGTDPYDATVEYSMQDDLMDAPVFANGWWGDDNGIWTVDGDWHELNQPSLYGWGSCLWMPIFCGSPDVGHIRPGGPPLMFEALLSDYCHAEVISYRWSSPDDVHIVSPNTRTTTVEMASFPSWGRFSLNVMTEICGRELSSAVVTTIGTNSAPTPAGVSVSFSKAAILFEREYEEWNGVTVPRISDSSVLHCAVSGGEFGGIARFDINTENNLIRVSGQTFPVVKQLEPGEDYSFDVVYKGALPSETFDDIVVSGELHGMDGSEYQDAAGLTVVEVETGVRCPWIPYPHRKRLGVREGMDVCLNPAEAELTANFGKCECANSQWFYLAPARACTDSLPIRFRGSEHVINLTILEPELIQAGACQVDILAAEGQSGGFVGNITLYVCPTNVSFSNIETMEVPSVSTDATGYFAESQCVGLWNHGEHGAGIWHGVGRQNRFVDRAGYLTQLPEPWGAGGAFSWPIENAWRTSDQPATTNLFSHLPSYDQYFELSSDGTASIRKFGYCISRGTNGVVTVSRSGL